MNIETELGPFPDDAELDHLDQFLRAQHADDALLLDGVHGLMTALALGPEPALPDEWLAEVLRHPFDDASEGQRILDLLARLNESVQIEMGSEEYQPILGEMEQAGTADSLSAAGWCEGFSRGIDLRAAMWEARLAADPDLIEMLGPIMALAIEEGVFVSEGEFERLSTDDYVACLNQISNSVAALAQYWRVHPPTERERTASGSASARSFKHNPGRRAGRWLH